MHIDQYTPFSQNEVRESVSSKGAVSAPAAQAAASDERVLRGKEGSPFALAAWPTSQPGPRVTEPLPGQRLVPLRTDQVMYDSYDQQRGLPGLLSPTSSNQERAKHQ